MTRSEIQTVARNPEFRAYISKLVNPAYGSIRLCEYAGSEHFVQTDSAEFSIWFEHGHTALNIPADLIERFIN